ncbi:MAG: protein-disulfide reductase DsbD family protein, partial [Limisphaerales bacterium]
KTEPSAADADIKKWQGRVPQDAKGFFRVAAGWEKPANGDTRPLIISAVPGPKETTPIHAAEFFPDASDNYEILPANDTLETSPELRLRKNVKLYSGSWPAEIRGVLVINSGHQRLGFTVQSPISDQPPLTAAAPRPSSTQTNAPVAAVSPGQPGGKGLAGSFAKYLLYAFIGGLILNVMPCVLPVIALKILGFVSEARSEPRRVRNLGFIYAAGVLASFAAMAAIVIGIKSAGQQAGWGMQFGSPVFVVCLTTLIVLVALNLFGVFEVTPGGKVLNAAGHLVSRHGAPGAFFNGLLATTLATPCTAPFLAGALVFAFAQSAGVILLIFLFAGIGLAAPYVLLSCNPALLKFLPKPGAWMEKFRVIMGFPMLATAVWLFNVAASDYGSRVLWLGVFLVIVALAAWIFGEFIQRGRRGKGLATAVVVILLVGGYTFALEGHLHWRRLMAQKDPANSLIDSSAGGVVWKPWSPKAVAQARTEGKPVLVDFTAAWCVTCNAVVKPALENPAVVSRLREINAATLIADYTRVPPRMTDEISKYGGAGVPLVLVFPGNPNAQPIVLRQPDPIEFPSSYSKAILAALNQAELE